MPKVRVLQLSGCSRCHELIAKLEMHKINYDLLDADHNDKFASAIETLVGSSSYPMIHIEHSPTTIVLYLARDTSQLKLQSADTGSSKLGCLNLDAMIENLSLIINN